VVVGQIVHCVVDLGQDSTGCGIWYYLTYAAKEGKKVAIVPAQIVSKHTNTGDLTSSKQQLGIMYEDEEPQPYLVYPHKQTLFDLQ
jgi:dTDP-4-dehydrorhamnose 3,5-epimerase-like enzyme